MDWPLRGDGQQIKAFGISGGTPGTSIATPTATNQKGAWTEIASSLSVNANALLLFISPETNTSKTWLVDIGVGPAGSEFIIINNLFTTMPSGVVTHYRYFYFPIHIPQGTRIAARAQSNSATADIKIGIWAFSQGFLPSIGFSVVETLGAVISDSGGTQIVPGASHSKGNYSVISTSTERDIYELTLSLANSNGDYTVGTSMNGFLDIAIGPAGAERIIIPDLFFVMSTLTDMVSNVGWPTFPVHIPKNSRVSARIQSTIASPESVDIILYGLS